VEIWDSKDSKLLMPLLLKNLQLSFI